ncbi:Iron siderophore sensor protein [Sandaracinus amylolyticus]|nr:Iron siderophore sensor protein [Sandaracinus amylolyticus]
MSAPEPLPPPRSLAKWVEPPLDDVKLEKQWSTIRERRGHRRGSLWGWWIGGTSVIAIAAAIAVFVMSREAPIGPGTTVAGATVSSTPGAVIESGPAPIDVRLADGSEIALDPSTRLEATEAEGRDVRFALRHGRATFEVARDEGRRFVVAAGEVEVVVVGTRFSVASEASRVAVHVTRGRVDVHTGRAVHQLAAGETWSGDAVARDEDVAVPSEDAIEETTDRERPRREGPSANDLFESAREARREGRDAEAAGAYEQLLRRHPRDGHAGLAAFELARIRMDSLGDERGAIEPLERAISAGVFREDAMARLVRAYDETGQDARCRTARERYVRAYPEGVHRAQVEGRCAE